jgi:elongation factor 1-beta
MPVTVENIEKKMAGSSYMKGYAYSEADVNAFKELNEFPSAKKSPNAYRWALHIAALSGIR